MCCVPRPRCDSLDSLGPTRARRGGSFMADKLSSTIDVLLLIAFAIGPSLIVGGIVWLAWFKRARLTARSAGAIFAVAAVCSIGLASHTIMPAPFFLMFPNERLFWLGWMVATGVLVTAVVALVSRFLTPDEVTQQRPR